jgi:predicted short-subunit dehydrogenase-like oxidoreductase (DUF2520 family)
MEEASVETEILAPILRETVEKAISMGAGRSQTGPARRGDEDTKRKHLELLKSNPEWEKLYTFISRDIGRISE